MNQFNAVIVPESLYLLSGLRRLHVHYVIDFV
jgi:hypothetical protein